MLESLKIIIDETFEIYSLATLGGRLFIPFFICLLFIFLVPSKEDDWARKYLVYPSLILLFFLFNPVFIHILYKYIEVPERIVRMYWPLPMDLLFIYCVMRLFDYLEKKWKKLVLLVMAVALLVLNTGGSFAAQGYTLAENTEKMPKGTKEMCDMLYVLNGGQDPYVIMPFELFFWTRQYNPTIRLPLVRDMDDMETEDGDLDLDIVAKNAIDSGCRFVVFSSATSTVGELEDHGFKLAMQIEGQDCQYLIYMI